MPDCRNMKALLEGNLSEFYRIGGPNDIADLDIADLWLYEIKQSGLLD